MKKPVPTPNNRWLIRYSALLLLFAVFSFSLTDPNLVLTSWNPYWQFQQWMWQTFFKNAPLLTYTYAALVTGLFLVYFAAFRKAVVNEKNNAAQPAQPRLLSFIALILLTICPLFVSYNMLSHDVFNYIFNAKMVIQYHANPHVQVALDFPQDDWTRFMHNTHTPAPYGMGWTAFSLIPYLAGMGKFTLTWLIFRGWSVLGIILTICSIFYLHQKLNRKLVTSDLLLLFLNPLFIIETISTMHNDLWMMVPAVLAIGLVVRPGKQKSLVFLFSALLLIASTSIKLATVVLLPVWFFFVLYHFAVFARIHQSMLHLRAKKLANLLMFTVNTIKEYWAEASVGLLFVPLLTDRAQQFHPWYLSWLLVWIPFLKVKWMKWGIILLSISSLFRYLPWLWTGGFSDQEMLQEKAITWIPFIVAMTLYFIYRRVRPAAKANSR
jgi:hypothetical protein